MSRYSNRQISISRTLSVVLALLTIIAAGIVFEEKREAGRIASEVSRLSTKITEQKERMSELKAEWSLLEQPARLQAIVERHADRFPLEPIRTDQIGAVADAPFRPVDLPTADPAAPPAVSAKAHGGRPAVVEAPFIDADVPQPGTGESDVPTIDTLLRRPLVEGPDPETTGSLPSPAPGPGPLATQPTSEPPPVLLERPAVAPARQMPAAPVRQVPAAPASKASAPAVVPNPIAPAPIAPSPVVPRLAAPSPAETVVAAPPPVAAVPPAVAAPRGPALRASGPIATGGPMSLSFER